jgi:hypothetical protein
VLRQSVRLLTACAVIGLCALALVRGVGIARFADARAHAGAPDSRADVMWAWIDVPGVAALARQAMLTGGVDPRDSEGVRQREAALTAVLAARPLSSEDWLSLAGARLVAREPYDKVLAALAMSSVTGPNEGNVMFRRGTFGLVQWEILPADVRRRVIVDLAAPTLTGIVLDVEAKVARDVLSVKDVGVRDEIAGLLRAEGVLAKDLARIGL